MPRPLRALGLLVVLGVAAACASAGRAGAPWEAPLGRDHPLTGRIWDVAGARFIEPPELIARLVAARFVLLGEHHDNRDHHRLQARVVRDLVAAGRRPAVAFEMLTRDQAPALAQYLARSPKDAAGLGPAVGWERTGWPPWPLYAPIAQAALDAGLPILAANLRNETVRVLTTGEQTSAPADLAGYGLDRPLPPATDAIMAQDIRDSHCGQAPEPLVRRMIFTQRVRDARLAETMLDGEKDGAVLIAGEGHVRRDHGVPTYLALRRPDATIAVLGFLEVLPDHPSPADYAEHFDDASRLPFDFAWFTPRVSVEYRCETFKKSLERLHR